METKSAGASGPVVVIGLDCLEPSLAFGRYASQMPNLQALCARGIGGTIRSVTPPITVPAWMCSVTGKDPGELGIYGFRNRNSYAYDDYVIPTRESIIYPAVWDVLSAREKRCLVVGVPLTYPAKLINGKIAASFLTPSKDTPWTAPRDFSDELDTLAGGEYLIDVKDFRTHDKGKLLASITEMTQQRFHVMRSLLSSESYDFSMFVEMGLDRLHHGFWRYCIPEHRLYEAGNPWESVFEEYYHLLDDELGQLLSLLSEDATVLLYSDHGAQSMQGGFRINEWLRNEGFLVLREEPNTPVALRVDMIDWGKTRVWSTGGYYGRIFLNVEGREPEGIIPEEEYDAFLVDLKARICAIPDADGKVMKTRVERPRELFRRVKGIPPDLFIFFDDLAWRSIGSVGEGDLYVFKNDTGPDDANHAWDGCFVASGNKINAHTPVPEKLTDIFSFILKLFA